MDGMADTPSETRQYRLRHRPEGQPSTDDFELTVDPLPDMGHDDVLVATRYLSVDPYMRGRMRDRESYAEPWAVGDVMQGGVVGEVVESNAARFDPGDIVTGRLNWADYSIAPAHQLAPVDPDIAPISTALSVLGMPGRTAYFGMLDIGRPRPGDTVLVSGAAGAVGSVAGQIAKLAGGRVVGIAGTDEKVDWIVGDLGFDAGINYRTEDVATRINETCPDGIDVYFDNVGGPITDSAVANLALGARVAVCGQIALYNEESVPVGPRKLWTLIEKRARIEGFLVTDFSHRRAEATDRLGEWVTAGDLQYRETVVKGLEQAPVAFIGLFQGENIGKQLVAVDPDMV